MSIGSQIRGINITELFNCELIATSDIDKEAVLSYAAIHCGLTEERISKFVHLCPPDEEMRRVLLEKNVGLDLKKGTNPIARMKGRKLQRYWMADKVSKNLGDISKVEELPYADCWTYSFPCQSISVSGRQEGIVKGETRSGLVYEVFRLLDKAKEEGTLPKYLLMENVSNLIGERFVNDFINFLEILTDIGYETTFDEINAKNCGVPQNRSRIFAISRRIDE